MRRLTNLVGFIVFSLVVGILCWGGIELVVHWGKLTDDIPKSIEFQEPGLLAKPEDFTVDLYHDTTCHGRQYRIRIIHKPTRLEVSSDPILRKNNNATVTALFGSLAQLLRMKGYDVHLIDDLPEAKE